MLPKREKLGCGEVSMLHALLMLLDECGAAAAPRSAVWITAHFDISNMWLIIRVVHKIVLTHAFRFMMSQEVFGQWCYFWLFHSVDFLAKKLSAWLTVSCRIGGQGTFDEGHLDFVRVELACTPRKIRNIPIFTGTERRGGPHRA